MPIPFCNLTPSEVRSKKCDETAKVQCKKCIPSAKVRCSFCCAGSLLGIALHEGTSFPVGKVDFLKLGPLSYREFLMATGKEQFAELLKKQDYPMISSFKQTYIDALKQYYFVGGMPEAVQCFAEDADFNEVREIQKRILAAYEQDFSKHAP